MLGVFRFGSKADRIKQARTYNSTPPPLLTIGLSHLNKMYPGNEISASFISALVQLSVTPIMSGRTAYFRHDYSRSEQTSIDADYNLDAGLRSYVNFKYLHHQPR